MLGVALVYSLGDEGRNKQTNKKGDGKMKIVLLLTFGWKEINMGMISGHFGDHRNTLENTH